MVVNYTLTDRGVALISGSAPYTFTRVVIGSGVHAPGEDLTSTLYITSNPVGFDVSGVAVDGSTVTVSAVITNATFASPYTIREIGLIAKSNNVEQLFLIGVASIADTMPAHAAAIPDVICDFSIKIAIANTTNVTVQYAPAVYARATDFNTLRERVNTLVTGADEYYVECESTDAGALEVIADGSTAATGEILLAAVTPCLGAYTPAVGDYVRKLSNTLTAELVDARTDDLGETYASVGEMIRTRLGELQESGGGGGGTPLLVHVGDVEEAGENDLINIDTQSDDYIIIPAIDNDTPSDQNTYCSNKIELMVAAAARKTIMLEDNSDIMTYINSLEASDEDICIILRAWAAYGVPTNFGYEDGNNNDFWYEVYLTAARDYGRVIAHDVHSDKTFIRTKTNNTWNDWRLRDLVPINDLATNVTGYALDSTQGRILNERITALMARIEALEAANDIVTPETPTNPGSYSVLSYGADSTGATYSTSAFKQAYTAAAANGAKVYVPAGTYKIKWWGEDWVEASDEMDPSILPGNFEGVGDIIIDKFPQPGNRETNFNPQLISAKYENCFGKFNMVDVDRPLIMDMHLTHEARSNMTMYHTNFGPVKRHYEPDTSNPDGQGRMHTRFNCWGQIALRYDKIGATRPSGNVRFNIGRVGLMCYNSGAWTIMDNPYCQDAAMFDKAFTNPLAGSGNAVRTLHDGYVTYEVPWSMFGDYLLHYWSPDWTIPNPTTIKYLVGFVECWLDTSSAQYADWFCFNSGIDMITPAGIERDHDEYATGRFVKLGATRRREYIHNVRYYETEGVLRNAGLEQTINNKAIVVS